MESFRSLEGNWRICSVVSADLTEYVRIIPDKGRWIHFAHTDESGENGFSTMALFFEHIEEHRFYFWVTPEFKWEVGLIPVETGIIIDRYSKGKFHLSPASKDELPDWFDGKIAETNRKMDKSQAVKHDAPE